MAPTVPRDRAVADVAEQVGRGPRRPYDGQMSIEPTASADELGAADADAVLP